MTEPRFKLSSDGRRYAVQQCPKCGWSFGLISIKKAEARLGPLKPFDFDLDAQRETALKALYRARSAAKSVYWWTCYGSYLDSVFWEIKRRRIMNKGGGRCAECGAPATMIHHLTYERVDPTEVKYSEDDDDLIPICAACHKEKHPHMGSK